MWVCHIDRANRQTRRDDRGVAFTPVSGIGAEAITFTAEYGKSAASPPTEPDPRS